MKKIATILSFLVFQTLYCQSVLSKFPLKGSLLCGEKTYGVTLFDDTLMMFSVAKRTIITDTLAQIIKVTYDLEFDKPRANKNDTIILNNHIPPFESTFFNNYWRIQRIYNYKLIGGANSKPDTTTNTFTPYGTCFNVSYNCDSIVFERNILKSICPIIGTKGQSRFVELINDTIIATYIDTLVYNPFYCLAVGYKREKSTVTFKTLKNKLYSLIATSKEEFTGFMPAIPINTQPIIAYLGKADLSKCIPTAVDDAELNTNDVYPNPASEKVHITSKPEIIQLIDVYGQKHSINGSGKYDVSQFKKGIYTVLYQQNGNTLREKLVIE